MSHDRPVKMFIRKSVRRWCDQSELISSNLFGIHE
jgi:hypothetical protein